MFEFKSIPIFNTKTLRIEKFEGVEVHIAPETYQLCEVSSDNMDCNHKTGAWGSGARNHPTDPRKVERTGRLGEAAFSEVFKVPVDYSYIEKGDECDFHVGDFKVDVKTALEDRPRGLVRATNHRQEPLEQKSDWYIFGYVLKDDRENKTATMRLVGGITKENMMNRETIKAYAKNTTHLNYEVHFRELVPVRELLDILK
jgi:hypothetical protein